MISVLRTAGMIALGVAATLALLALAALAVALVVALIAGVF